MTESSVCWKKVQIWQVGLSFPAACLPAKSEEMFVDPFRYYMSFYSGLQLIRMMSYEGERRTPRDVTLAKP